VDQQKLVDRALMGLMILLILGLIWFAVASLQPSIVQAGDRAPDFAITTEQGNSLTPTHFGGKLLVLNFWATWCGGCVEEMASLSRFQRTYAEKGIVVLAISVDRNEKKYQRFLGVFQLSFKTWRDPEAEMGLAARYGTFQFPETYVIDSSGHIAMKLIGAQDFSDPDFTSRIQKLL
jgi:peroxiredoxin